MKLLKKALLGLCVSVVLCYGANAQFAVKNTYSDGQFSDVPQTQWYAPEVKSTYELGLMNGISDSLFSPSGNVTVSQAITMAARACAENEGIEIPTSTGKEWYSMYVDFAKSRGFVKDGQFDSYERNAKRYEVAQLFENAMPSGYFTSKNNIDSIPDVSEKQPYHDDLLSLYRAGIVAGSDSYGNFRPEDNITRAEAAAIINRVALPQNRLTTTLDKMSQDDAYTLALTSGFNSDISGIASGWILDNRGGLPRTDITSTYALNYDISTKAGVALIREFNKTETGKIDFYIDVAVGGGDGFYIEFQNDAGNSVYRLQITDGDWKLLGSDGKYTTIYPDASKESRFVFNLTLDLDNNRSTTEINGKDCGTYSLSTSGDKTNLYNFRFATTKESKANFVPACFNAYANYAINESFSNAGGNIPKDWSASEGAAITGELSKEVLSLEKNARVNIYTSPVSGKAIGEFNVILPEGESASYSLKSGIKDIALFTTDANSFYVNGTKVYDYIKNLWYRIRLELDTDSQKILVKVNGRKVADIDFASSSTSVDTVSLTNLSDTTVSFDNFRLFREVQHDDYVPTPKVPDGADDYLIGMNVCSLWENGTHFGWACITPFDDPQSVLGYYDENNSETADWEIKYLVEHGIDFQAFCIFVYGKGPINIGAGHLFNGFMNAKYSDLAKFSVIVEAANGDTPSSLDDWKQYWVPYFIENFYKDPRFVKIGNKPVLCMFDGGSFAKRIGGNDIMKQAFDYMEEEVKKAGFDGMIYLCCGSSSEAMKQQGFDGCYAYNWGTSGNRADVNQSSMLKSAEQGSVYTVPTVSVGFNNVPWSGSRNPMMTMNDYRTVNEWVKNEYLPTYAKEDWQKNFVMLSTWNEYGEGTYIMPSTDSKGFGYIDVIREVYTKEKTDASLNTIPTANQSYRINHLYPQYRRLLRKLGYYGTAIEEGAQDIDLSKLDVLGTIDFSKATSMWNVDKDSITRDENGLTAKGENNDPIVFGGDIGADISTSDVKAIKFTAKIPKGVTIQILYTTTDNTGWDEVKCRTFVSTSDDMTDYILETSAFNKWTGVIKSIRIDPVDRADTMFTIKSMEFLGKKTEVNYDEYSVVHALPVNSLKDDDLWNITGIKRGDDGISGHGANNDPIFFFGDIGASVETDTVQAIRITAKIPKGVQAELLYTTSNSTGWDEVKCKKFVSDSDEMKDYLIITSSLNNWTGTIRSMRFDPAADSTVNFTLKAIDLLSKTGSKSKKLTIDGNTFDNSFEPQESDNGEILIAFDPATAIDYRLNCFYVWDKSKGVITLNFTNHTIVYTVGSSKYTLDGTSKDLGFTFTLLDGLPLIPIKQLCSDVGYKYTLSDDGIINIETELMEYYNSQPEFTPGKWEFETVGNNESWTSGYMSLMTYGGYMSCESLTKSYDNNDPTLFSANDLGLIAAKYKSLEIKVRYKYEAEKPDSLTMYYVTDRDGQWNEKKTLKALLDSTNSNGEWETYTIDLGGSEDWAGTVRRLRFDPFNAVGHMDIDYIRFIENPDYDGTVPDDANAYKIPEGVEEENAEYGKLIWYNDFDNGKATNPAYAADGIKFTCGGASANVEVVSNPFGSGNSLKISPVGDHGGYEIKFTEPLKEPGTYTFIVDYYIPGGASTQTWIRFDTENSEGAKSDPNFWNSTKYITGTDEWCEYPQSMSVTKTSGFISSYSVRKTKPEVHYIDNVRIYFKAAK